MLALMAGVPYLYYRHSYTYGKRLRPVEAGRVYRSGCLTAQGFEDAIKKYKIKTVINLMEEAQDPALPRSNFDPRTLRESEVCAKAGAKYRFLFVDLVAANRVGQERPATIEQFLALMDDPETYPVLFHCRAGLHRTGVLAALYRMEYHGWTRAEAYQELKAHGFGESTAHSGNAQVLQYVLAYQPRRPRPAGALAPPARPVPAALTARPARP
jgi:protein tyrosine/serine phosphatase